MGLQVEGQALSWEDTKKQSKKVREYGIQQFIQMFSRIKDRRGDVMKWGDEVRQKDDTECVGILIKYFHFLD